MPIGSLILSATWLSVRATPPQARGRGGDGQTKRTREIPGFFLQSIGCRPEVAFTILPGTRFSHSLISRPGSRIGSRRYRLARHSAATLSARQPLLDTSLPGALPQAEGFPLELSGESIVPVWAEYRHGQPEQRNQQVVSTLVPTQQ